MFLHVSVNKRGRGVRGLPHHTLQDRTSPGPYPSTGTTKAGGMHPTGMFSCFIKLQDEVVTI